MDSVPWRFYFKFLVMTWKAVNRICDQNSPLLGGETEVRKKKKQKTKLP